MNSLMMDDHMGSPEPTPLTVVEEPKTETKDIVLTALERLKAENLSLRAMVLQMKRGEFIAGANAKVAEFDRELQGVSQGIQEFQAELNERYGIDFTKFQIEPGTGRLIPAG